MPKGDPAADSNLNFRALRTFLEGREACLLGDLPMRAATARPMRRSGDCANATRVTPGDPLLLSSGHDIFKFRTGLQRRPVQGAVLILTTEPGDLGILLPVIRLGSYN